MFSLHIKEVDSGESNGVLILFISKLSLVEFNPPSTAELLYLYT